MSKYPKHARIKPKRLQDAAHLNAVRQLPCALCGEDRSDIHRAAHHLLRGPTRGMGLKAPDSAVIPLCTVCHMETHACGDEVGYFAMRGLKDAPGMAKALYETSGDHAAMLAAMAEYRAM